MPSSADKHCLRTATSVAAAALGSADAGAFAMTRARVPMRDGVSLETVLFAPRAAPKPLPIVLQRTPYGVPTDAQRLMGEWYASLRADGYIFVWQSVRGRFGSEGTFVSEGVPRRDRSDRQAVDETTDADDTIEWLSMSTFRTRTTRCLKCGDRSVPAAHRPLPRRGVGDRSARAQPSSPSVASLTRRGPNFTADAEVSCSSHGQRWLAAWPAGR
jgi:hypothetical protein